MKINIIGLLSKLNRKDVIIVIIDRFIKIIRLKVTIMNVSSKKIAKIYRNQIWKLNRILKKILSDRKL